MSEAPVDSDRGLAACPAAHPGEGGGFVLAGRTRRLHYRHPAWWYLTELPQGRNAARVGELFQVRGVSFVVLGARYSGTNAPLGHSVESERS